ncbi:unnamed protein product [Paramecium sonneborni]|uniref:Protein S-acyltransferase n=1 Tax=Paramecium sonneborni TaxID=65129 RepID=A0A8S1Q373_9CILI|nr:unnamed protein product [Paramecium sonneborni]
MNQIEEEMQFEEITKRKQYQIICLLLEKDIKFYNLFQYQNQQPLLHNLIIEKQVEVAHYVINLIQNCSQNPLQILDQPNPIQQTPLIIACYYGQLSIIKHLLKLGVNINKKDDHNFTPLLFSIKSNQTYIAIYLIYKGAEVFVKDLNGCSLAHWSAYNNNLFMLKILKNLFKLNLFEMDKKQKTPLARAQDQLSYECLNYLQSLQKKNTVKNKYLAYFKMHIQQHLYFITITILNLFILSRFTEFEESYLKHGSLFLQLYNIFFNFMLFYIIENAQMAKDAYQTNKNNVSSFNMSNEVFGEGQGCLEIDQTIVPFICDDHNNNQSMNMIYDSMIEIEKPFIRHIVQSIDQDTPIQFQPDQLCLDCMIVKLPKTEHCDQCKCCHPNFQICSSFYKKCLQDDWIFKFYFTLIITQFCGFIIYLYSYVLDIQFEIGQIEINFTFLLVSFITLLVLHQFIYILVLLYGFFNHYTYFEIMNLEKCWYRYKTIIKDNLVVRVLK